MNSKGQGIICSLLNVGPNLHMKILYLCNMPENVKLHSDNNKPSVAMFKPAQNKMLSSSAQKVLHANKHTNTFKTEY